MIVRKQKLTENLKFRAIANTGIAAFLFAQTGGCKMIKKKKKRTKRKRQMKKYNYEFWKIYFASAAFAFGPSVIQGSCSL